MDKQINEIQESYRNCPFCKTEGKVVRVLKYGIKKSEEQVKLKCPECFYSWKYHTDDK